MKGLLSVVLCLGALTACDLPEVRYLQTGCETERVNGVCLKYEMGGERAYVQRVTDLLGGEYRTDLELYDVLNDVARQYNVDHPNTIPECVSGYLDGPQTGNPKPTLIRTIPTSLAFTLVQMEVAERTGAAQGYRPRVPGNMDGRMGFEAYDLDRATRARVGANDVLPYEVVQGCDFKTFVGGVK